MQLVISALERQTKLEEAKCLQREMMLANQSDVLFDRPLQQSNPQYLEELKLALEVLKKHKND